MVSRGLILAITLAALTACDQEPEAPQAVENTPAQALAAQAPEASPQPAAFDPAIVAQGRTLYVDHCAACHGVNLEGAENWRERNPDGSLPAPPHDQTGHTWHHGDRILFDYTRLGGAVMMGDTGFVSAMPGFGEILTDDEIWAVLTYIKSTWPPRAQEAQAKMTAAEAE